MKTRCFVSGLFALLVLPSQALDARIEIADHPGFPSGEGAWFDHYRYDYQPGVGWSAPLNAGGDDWHQPLEFRIVARHLAPGTPVDVVVTYTVSLDVFERPDSFNLGGFDRQSVGTTFMGSELVGPGTFSVSILVTAPAGEWTSVDAALSGMTIQTDGLLALDPSRPASAVFSADGEFRYTSVTIPQLPDTGSSIALLLFGTLSLAALRRSAAPMPFGQWGQNRTFDI